ncbi:NADH-quinone oxidoreductase subunit NuoE [Pseudohongiella nitratireducens]|uniref:NADH-quinone oxidoreductase subunit NuoE n=1 Tax=Pseudohongiella nitratireducens TaxID=1768907 RepID=UPI003C6DDF4A|tara:strand:+ start:612 stop:1145 length:534 start_codon:yes stop_codon:yes gene_type:complete
MSEMIATTKKQPRQLSAEEIREIEHEKTHYPYTQAVGLEALKIVQKHQGWVSDESLLAVAEYLDIPVADLEGVATFFNMIFRRPVGKNVICLCDSVACWMLGCDDLKAQITSRLGIEYGETTEDGEFTLLPVPCLGACDKAPVLMVGRETHRHVDHENLDQLLNELQRENTKSKKTM